MATAKKPTKTAEAKKPSTKKTGTKSIVPKPPVKKAAPKTVIKPKQVKDLSNPEPETKESEMDILKQLLQQSPDRINTVAEKPAAPVVNKTPEEVVERKETGIKNVYQAYQDPETGVGMNRPERTIPAPAPRPTGQRTLGSILNRVRDRQEDAPRRPSWTKK